jgi:hypothetical protein
MNSTKSFGDLVNIGMERLEQHHREETLTPMVTVPRDHRRLDEFVENNEDFLDRALKNDVIASEDFEINLGSLTLHLTDQATVLCNFDDMTKASDNISVKIRDSGEWVTGDHGLKWHFSEHNYPKLVGPERTYSKENSVFFFVTDANDPAYWCLVIVA